MKSWEIHNAQTGVRLGVFGADTREEALELLAQDAGYRTYAEACEVAPVGPDEIIVTELAMSWK